MVKRPEPNTVQASALSRLQIHRGQYVIGIDEVGNGACAGPLVVAGVLALRTWDHELARDSKKLTPKRREKGYETFVEIVPDYAGIRAIFIAEYNAADVDRLSLGRAHYQLTVLVAKTLYALEPAPIVLDGDMHPHLDGIPSIDVYNIISADALVASVGAASVVAKVFRDNEMQYYDEVFPGYDWKQNKGYWSKRHQQGVEQRGACAQHRISYSKVKPHVLDSRIWQYRQQQTETHAWTSFLLR